jgi:tripartite-type tricarboxylate transporter receptor subunit TctC
MAMHSYTRRKFGAALVSCIACGLIGGSHPAAGQTAEDFYRGKTVRLIVGADGTGEYGVAARLLARHFPRHIPGNPNVIVQFMPGASSIKSLNYLYAAAPKDGLVIGMPNKAAPMFEAAHVANVNYKSAEFSWIGNMTRTNMVVIVSARKGVRTLDDAKKTEVIVGAIGTGGTMATYPTILNAVAGTKFKIVIGYAGGQIVDLAMERGEVDARGSYAWSDLKRVRSDWLRDRKIYILAQVGLRKEPDLPDVPTLVDLARNDNEGQILRFISTDAEMTRPFMVPPGVPADRVAALRTAFDETMRDDEFVADAKRQGTSVEAMSGAAVQDLVTSIVNTPPAIVEAAGRWMTLN